MSRMMEWNETQWNRQLLGGTVGSQAGTSLTAPPLIADSAEFTGDFSPPDYLIAGLLQRRNIYSLTASTGTGKTAIAQCISLHVGLGRPLAGRQVSQGKVLFFAGENPDDIRMRWMKVLADENIEAASVPVFWCPGSNALGTATLRNRVAEESKRKGPFSLIVVDTSAAFFLGDDENNNAQMGNHARNLRSLCSTIDGGPTVIVSCHPTKTANPEALLPRGGGAFLAEVDGNLILSKKADSRIIEMHWQGKFRGPDFAAIPFTLSPGTAPGLVDSRGNEIMTVTARTVSNEVVDEADAAARHRQMSMLAAVYRNPSASIAEYARQLRWQYSSGEPNKTLADRTLKALENNRLIKREGNSRTLTKAGKAALKPQHSNETVVGKHD